MNDDGMDRRIWWGAEEVSRVLASLALELALANFRRLTPQCPQVQERPVRMPGAQMVAHRIGQ